MSATIALPFRLLGYSGLIPFAAAAVALFGPASWRGLALPALAAYGAVILSFLGGVHWGLALRATPEEAPAAWPRLALGVLPALVGWVALLLPARPGLALLAAGVLAVAAVETAAARRGLVPRSYLGLRWALSLGAGACLLLGALAAGGGPG
jgi:hypothetical protein